MAISFNNIPTTVRTPGVYNEIDNSRALQGLVDVPHTALIIGQKHSSGTAAFDTLQAITNDNLANGYFGNGAMLSRMCNVFKANNPNTELFAIAIGSGIGGVAASATINFSAALSTNTASGTGTYYLLINGNQQYVDIISNMSGAEIASVVKSTINGDSTLPVVASFTAGTVFFSAVNSGTQGNYIDIRANYYVGQSTAKVFSVEPTIVSMAGGTTDPDLGDAWAVIADRQFHYIIQPYIDAANLTEIETELADRFKPLEDLQGHGFTAVKATQASCTTLGNSRNSPHNTILGVNNGPNAPEEWAAAIGAQAAFNLNQDPARPLTGLKLINILPPTSTDRFDRSERDILLYDGIATYTVDTGGNVQIERCITTYQTNSAGLPDPSYLDVQTLATLEAIRYQYKLRMTNRFIVPRFKLADDTFQVQPGQKIVQPKTIKLEIISLMTQLANVKGWVENIEDFVKNLIVERNASDRNRVDVLLPPDLVNQFRILASLIQFVL